MGDTGMATTDHAYRLLIHGRVQGVHFREFVRLAAMRHSIIGHVRNLPDGSTVEVHGQGAATSLQAFLKDLRSGPALSRVDWVEEMCLEARSTDTDFTIIW